MSDPDQIVIDLKNADLTTLQTQQALVNEKVAALVKQQVTDNLKKIYTNLPLEGIYVVLADINGQASAGLIGINYNGNVLTAQATFGTLSGERRQLFSDTLVEKDGILQTQGGNIVIKKLIVYDQAFIDAITAAF